MSHFGDGCLEQAILDWVELEMKFRNASVLDVSIALARVIEAVIQRHENKGIDNPSN